MPSAADLQMRRMAQAALELRRRQFGAMPMLDFVPAITPEFRRPEHLRLVAALYDRIAAGETVRAVVSCPPRHGKSELEMHGIAKLLAQDPRREIGFVAYGAKFSQKMSRRIRKLASAACVPMSGESQTAMDWRTGVADGGLWATSVGGAITGTGFHLLCIDDPVKGREEAESPTVRESTMEFLRADAITRLHPGGSCILTQTRWHPSDPAGVLIEEGWESIVLPAIQDGTDPDPSRAMGSALAPWRYDLDALAETRKSIGEYNWSSLYQGSPRPRGGALFEGVTTYKTLPATMRKCIGLDFAYTAKSSADYSVAVVMGYAEGKFYVLDVVRAQKRITDFAGQVSALKLQHPRATLHAIIGGTEKATLDFLSEPKESRPALYIDKTIAKGDKFTRAQATSAAWNTGAICVPEDVKAHPWVSDYLAEVCGFTGVSDVHDDQVDATVAAFEDLRSYLGNTSLAFTPSR